MPRFYFHVRVPSGIVPDPEGADFSGLDAARTEALACACELAAERLRASKASTSYAVEIADEEGAVLDTLAVETLLK